MKKALAFLTVLLTLCFCGCEKTTGKTDEINYFGGKGELVNISGYMGRSVNYFMDNDSLYFLANHKILLKFNKNTQNLSFACMVPGCVHDNISCKSYSENMEYIVWNGKLIKKINETVIESNGSSETQGYLYLCSEQGEKKVFEMTIPDGLTSSEKESALKSILALDEVGDMLAVHGNFFSYILDSDFNIKYVALDVGLAKGAMYANGDIYYSSRLYDLKKISADGTNTAVDLGGMKVTSNVFDGEKIWLGNNLGEIYTYDPKTSVLEKRFENVLSYSLCIEGRYLRYKKKDSDTYTLLNIDNGTEYDFNEIASENEGDIYYCMGEKYYIPIRKDDSMYVDAIAEYNDKWERLGTYELN